MYLITKYYSQQTSNIMTHRSRISIWNTDRLPELLSWRSHHITSGWVNGHLNISTKEVLVSISFLLKNAGYLETHSTHSNTVWKATVLNSDSAVSPESAKLLLHINETLVPLSWGLETFFTFYPWSASLDEGFCHTTGTKKANKAPSSHFQTDNV